MNVITARNLGTALVLVAALTACKGNQAPPDATTTTPAPAVETAPAPAPAAAATTAPMAEMPMPAEGEAAPTSIPDTADAIWQAIDQHKTELKATIDSGSLGEVHHHAFAIRDLVAALPTHSPTLPPEDKAKLDSEVKFVTTLASRLDESGDAGDKAGAQANYDQLVTVLNGITRTK